MIDFEPWTTPPWGSISDAIEGLKRQNIGGNALDWLSIWEKNYAEHPGLRYATSVFPSLCFAEAGEIVEGEERFSLDWIRCFCEQHRSDGKEKMISELRHILWNE